MDNKRKDELQKLIVEEMNKIAAEKESELTNRGSHISCLFAFFAFQAIFIKWCTSLEIFNLLKKKIEKFYTGSPKKALFRNVAVFLLRGV